MSAERAAEVPIRVAALRITGRIDVFERSGARQVTVRDYKTGNIVDNEGKVRRNIALQLRLYGLAVQELLPGFEVRLLVCRGVEYAVSFTARDVAATRRWLDQMLSLLPAGASVAPESLASPGPVCRTCSIRHACAAYLREAPRLWAEGISGYTLPRDIWGGVIDARNDPRSVTIRLRDAAGRLVRVARLVHRPQLERFDNPAIWFFGLEASWPPVKGGEYFQPRNFHDLPGGPLEHRAWALAVFR